jgi:sulfite reductase (ferredoxin)
MRDDLVTLGSGGGSNNESIKQHSNLLRGDLVRAFDANGPSIEEDSAQLLKFHGSYQQDDRDERRVRRQAKQDKAYQFMVRTRIPGGVLTAAQYLAHDELAERFGNRTLRLTTRQGIQLHGVLKGNLKPAIRAINDALLTTLAACGDVNRNVMACPAPAHRLNDARVQAFAERIATHLTPQTRAYHELWLDGEKLSQSESEPIYGETYLPRKFKIAVASPGDNCVDAFTQDLAFVAELEDDALRGFTVLVGGGMGSTHGKAETFPRLATPLCFIEADDAVAIAEAIVTIFRDYGDRKNRKHARLKYVIEELGIDWMRAELERRIGRALENPRPIRFLDITDHLGWHQQANGLWFFGVHVLSGRVADRPASRVRSALREVVTRFAPGVRITGQQNLLLIDLHGGDRFTVETILRDHGVEVNPVALGIARNALACPALPTCGLAVAEAERALPGVLTEIECELAALGLDADSVTVRMTGCPNGCARPRMGEIGIVGRSADLYDIFVGGDTTNTRLNVPYAEGVRRDALVASLRPAFEDWKRERRSAESFGDFMHRTAGLTVAS